MCRPRSTGDVLFPQEMLLNAIDYDLDFSYEVKGKSYIGADFAMSTKASGDYNVFFVIDDAMGTTHIKKTDKGEITILNPVFLRWGIRYRGNVGQSEKIERLYENFKATKVIGDNSGAGAKFIKELKEKYLSVDAQDFQPAKRNLLLMSLRTLFEKNRIVIPGGSESTYLTDILLRELSGFRSVKNPRTGHESWSSNLSHDDTVMALALAVKSVSNPQKVMDDLIFGV
jgi:hypothetical protein